MGAAGDGGVTALGWQLIWDPSTPDDIDLAGHSAVADFAAVRRLERELRIDPNAPILLCPDGTVDPVLTRYIQRPLAALKESTRRAYLLHQRLFFDFLAGRNRYWSAADRDDVFDWSAWRVRSADNPRRVGLATFSRELAGLNHLYGWAHLVEGHIPANPVARRSVRLRDGREVTRIALQPRSARTRNVKWLTPRAYRRWRDIGLLGYGAGNLPDPGWRGRSDARNAAFADLLITSGLREREAGTLLIQELPATEEPRPYFRARLASQPGKAGGRDYWIRADAMNRITAYLATSRRAAVESAHRRHAYDDVAGKVIVTALQRNGIVTRRREDGSAVRAPLNTMSLRERTLLFAEGDRGLEPCQLWLTEGGLPMDFTAWNTVFARASARCARLGQPIYCTPHMLRHSCALRMLVVLSHVLDRRLGLAPEERRHWRHIYGDVWTMVRDFLGHASVETTRNHYLTPVTHLQIEHLLDDRADDDGLHELFGRLAAAAPTVADVAERRWRRAATRPRCRVSIWRADADHSPGLVVRPVGEDGTSLGVYDFATFPLGPQLQEAFAAAFDRHCGPGAAARRPPTCRSLFNALRRYAHFLAGADPPPRTVRDLRPPRLAQQADR